MADPKKPETSKDEKPEVAPTVFLKKTVQLSRDDSAITRITGGKTPREKGEREK